MNETWSLGVKLGLPVIALVIIGLIIASAWLYRKSEQLDDFDGPMVKWLARGSWAAAILVLIFALGSYYPYKAEYHKWVPKSGTVTNVDRRIIGGESINEKIVVTYEDGQQYGCNDTRCASVRVGDSLTLTCQRTWQYAGIDGYDCNFVQLRREG
jgi:hypothetical protein